MLRMYLPERSGRVHLTQAFRLMTGKAPLDAFILISLPMLAIFVVLIVSWFVTGVSALLLMSAPMLATGGLFAVLGLRRAKQARAQDAA